MDGNMGLPGSTQKRLAYETPVKIYQINEPGECQKNGMALSVILYRN